MSHNKQTDTIANTHLGRQADGTQNPVYAQSTQIDPSLLVAIPRHYNRTDYGILDAALPFTGVDVWHGYEFSCLLDNDYPLTAILKIIYPCESACLIESKSLKLYLNSYNMAQCGRTKNDALFYAQSKIKTDLSATLQSDIEVTFFDQNAAAQQFTSYPIQHLEDQVDILNLDFHHHGEDPAFLKIIDNTDSDLILWHSAALRSNCRVTHQPDWGDVFIGMKGKQAIDHGSLLQYLVSLRNENHFHEEICEMIFKRIYDLLNPSTLIVACLYTRRGGLDINPIRVHGNVDWSKIPLAKRDVFTEKLWRQ
jgi:7-cyano-7-deazaguanine reductase